MTEEALGSEKPVTEPPSLSIADSKLSLVLVLGSKKRVARIFPLRRVEPFSATGTISVALSRRKSSSSLP